MYVRNHVALVFKVLIVTIVFIALLMLTTTLYDFTVTHHRVERLIETIAGVVSEYNCIPPDFMTFIKAEFDSIVAQSRIFKSLEFAGGDALYTTAKDFGSRFEVNIIAKVDIFLLLSPKSFDGINVFSFERFINYKREVPCLRYIK